MGLKVEVDYNLVTRAEVIRHLCNSTDCLRKASEAAAIAKDNKLFSKLFELENQTHEIICLVMRGSNEEENKS